MLVPLDSVADGSNTPTSKSVVITLAPAAPALRTCDVKSAADVAAQLRLLPHPEGGFYRETFRDVDPAGGRGRLTLIYFLLTGDRPSAWHKVDAVETWHFYDGAPLLLSITGADDVVDVRLGHDLDDGLVPQAVVPAHAWQRAASLGAWSLVGCTVAPAFLFEGFVMAAPGFEPPRRQRPSDP